MATPKKSRRRSSPASEIQRPGIKRGLLVLSRKKEEEIIIGDNVCIKVIEICGDRVRLGLTAPASVVITRGELVTAVIKEKKDGLE